MRIALIKAGGSKLRFDLLIPDLGMAQVAGVALITGASVKLFDFDLVGINPKETIRSIEVFNPDVVAFKLFASNAHYENNLARILRKIAPKAVFVGGGPQSTLFGGALLEQLDSFDALLKGRAEETFPILLRAIAGELRYDDIPSLSWRQGDSLQENDGDESRTSHESYPAWEVFDFERYLPIGLVSLVAGCPRGCGFCSHNAVWTYGGKGRKSLAIESDVAVHHSLTTLNSLGGIRKFSVVDSFPILPRLDSFCAEIQRLATNCRWLAFGYVGAMGNRFHDYKSRGCVALWYGIESADDEMRRLLGKTFTLARAVEDIHSTLSAGIWTGIGFMFGLPGETDEVLERTVRFAQQFPKDSLSWSPFTLDPETPMARFPELYGLTLTPGWKKRIASLPEDINPADIPYFKVGEEWNSDLCLRRGKLLGYSGGGENKAIANTDYMTLAVADSDINVQQLASTLEEISISHSTASFADLRSRLM